MLRIQDSAFYLLVGFAPLAGAQARSATADSTGSPAIIRPGDSRLRPSRISDRVDTLSLLVTPQGSTERLYATLVRRVAHVSVGGIPAIRETQHYSFTDGRASDDTLDVRASTLAPMRYFSRNGKVSFDVRIDSTQINGWQTDTLGVRTTVHTESTTPFFVSIMTEAFIEAFPLDLGAPITIPVADPPAAAVSADILHAASADTPLNTVRGTIACVVVVGPGTTTRWIARNDGHLVRLRWTLPNGTTVWKLPESDASLRGAP